MGEWYNQSAKETVLGIGSSFGGITDAEAARRLEKYGLNELRRTDKVSALEVFLRQFRSTLVLLLVIAGAIAIYMDEITEAGVIAAVLLVNAAIGTYHEYRAENAVEALKKMQSHEATVLRGGKEKVINAKFIVPGDVIVLRAGDRVPADGRILEAASLKMDESTLTGESNPVEKVSERIDGARPLSERRNMAYSGTFVFSGRGLMLTLVTDDGTEIGKIYKGVSGRRELFPLQIKINRFSGNLGKGALVCVAFFTLFFGLVLGEDYGYEIKSVLELSIAQAVSFIPEGLPIVVTIALAIGVSEMARKKAVSRKLQAMETIGGVDYICVDKTGTLTLNRMSVKALVLHGKEYPVDRGTDVYDGNRPVDAGEIPGMRALLETGLLCNDSAYDGQGKRRIGEPIETAMADYAAAFSMDKERLSRAHPRKAEIQFDPKNKFMVTVNKDRNSGYAFHLKGSPEVVVRMCDSIITKEGARPITEQDLEDLLRRTEGLASRGLRMIGFAHKIKQKRIDRLEEGYVFLGLVGFQDPLRPEVRDSVRRAKEAGIKVVMITGDHRLTAENIAREAGIISDEPDAILSGEEMDRLDEEGLGKVLPRISVYARVTSEHKAQIVNIMKKKGYTVAMTGDGVNDAIALKDAHVGVALGSGTDVAKEAADIVITDDNFTSIVDAVEEGRHSAENLRRVIKYLFSTNVIEVLFLTWILLSPFWAGSLLPLALLPIHILYVNLVTDGVCDITLATEKKDRRLMSKKPRDFSGTLFPKEVWKFIAATTAVVLVALAWVYLHYLDEGVSIEHKRTAVFTLLILFKFWAAMNARTISDSLFTVGFFSNRYLVGAIGISFLLQLAVIYLPQMNEIMKTAPLGAMDWALLIAISSTLFIAFEGLKVLERRGVPTLS